MEQKPIVVHVVPATQGTWTFTDEKLTEQEDRAYASADLAAEAARKFLRQHGGGELIEHGADGEMREKELVGTVDTNDLEG